MKFFSNGPLISPEDDPYLRFEEIDSKENITWANEQSIITHETFLNNFTGQQFYDNALDILNHDARLTIPRLLGEYIYNFWQDTQHCQGVWRRTHKELFLNLCPEWEILLDIDALNNTEKINWVFKDARFLYPDYDLAMIALSIDGSDSVIYREFDIFSKNFVQDGFQTKLSKSHVEWIDRDTLYIAADWGQSSLTTSGYPRSIRKWQRGQDFSLSTEIFKCNSDELGVWVSKDLLTGSVYVKKMLNFWEKSLHVLINDKFSPSDKSMRWQELPIPHSAEKQIHGDWILLLLRYDWEENEQYYPAGTLLVANTLDVVHGNAEWKVIYSPDNTGGIISTTWTRNYLIALVLSNVSTQVRVYNPAQNWKYDIVNDLPESTTSSVITTQASINDEIFFMSSSFLSPPTLYYGQHPKYVQKILSSPQLFSTAGLITHQFYARSDDGTQIPYFVTGTQEAVEATIPSPCLLYGYGGFRNSLTPYYDGVLGKLWLSQGGVYVVANIRGGGEFGPQWHTSALKENRKRCFQDFSAVAKDLIQRGITTAKQLGAQGGSNGGLLMGVMYTHYSELFSAIVCQMPLLDMHRFHNLSAGASWIKEYGNPDTNDWKYISEYSPYHNISRGKKDYPPILIYASTRDDRVHPGHARKFYARLQEYGYQAYYYEKTDGGHAGHTDNPSKAQEYALTYAFLWKFLNRN